jgi:hypothetical protein
MSKNSKGLGERKKTTIVKVLIFHNIIRAKSLKTLELQLRIEVQEE